jgi:hypothetical protein
MSKYYCNRFGLIIDPESPKYKDTGLYIEVTPDAPEKMLEGIRGLFLKTGGEPAFPEHFVQFAINMLKEMDDFKEFLNEMETDETRPVCTIIEFKPSTNQLELF